MSEYAWCPRCGGLVALRRDGTYRKHNLPAQAGRGIDARPLICVRSWTYPDTEPRPVEDVPDPGGRFG